MRRKKTKKSDQMKPILERLLRDEEAQGQLRTAAKRLDEARLRAVRRGPSKAVQDKKLYTKVRQAAASLTAATTRLRGKPEPKPRRRKLVPALALAGGGLAIVAKKRSGSNAGHGVSSQPS